MLFNSYEYILAFLPIVFITYFCLNKAGKIKLAKGFLVGSSLFFYSWWNPIYLPVILVSMFFNFLVGKELIIRKNKKTKNQENISYLRITCNLLLLGYFKYVDFLIDNINIFTGSHISYFNIALPLAISFSLFNKLHFLLILIWVKLKNLIY